MSREQASFSGNYDRPDNKCDAFAARAGPNSAWMFEFSKRMKGCPKSLGHDSYIDAKRRYDCRKCGPHAETNALLMAMTHSELTRQLLQVVNCTVGRFPIKKRDGSQWSMFEEIRAHDVRLKFWRYGVEDKNVKAHYIPNLTGVIITTNHELNGIYLPDDDHRHFVAWWTPFNGNRNKLWNWYDHHAGLEGIWEITDFTDRRDCRDLGFGDSVKRGAPNALHFWHSHVNRLSGARASHYLRSDRSIAPHDYQAPAVPEVKWPPHVQLPVPQGEA
jgi:hypothetical protein